jgi:anti-sigma B factor antagonist
LKEAQVQLLSDFQSPYQVITVDETRIDAATAVQFKDAMRSLVEQETANVLLDLSRVDSIDSSGLGAVVAVMKFLGSGRTLELAGLRPKVQAVFRLTRMDHVIMIHESRDSALEQVARAS